MLKKTLFVLFYLYIGSLYAQNDSIVLANKDVLVGTVKGMSETILTFKTPYSNVNFQIKWLQVREFYSGRTFIVSLNDGKRIYTKIHNSDSIKNRLEITNKGKKMLIKPVEIVFIDRFNDKFFQRLHASVDLGISLRKAQNFQEITGNVELNYSTKKWRYTATINTVFSKQDSIQNVSRNEVSLNAIRFLQKEWFLIGGVDLYQNTDQNLKLRATESAGGGYYFKNTNRYLFGTAAGLSYNNETYFDTTTSNKNSLETFLKAQVNKYEAGTKLSFQASVTASPSVTEKGRFRIDSNANMKYKITSDLYVKTSLTYNYDNQPAAGSTEGDYTFQTSFGWNNN